MVSCSKEGPVGPAGPQGIQGPAGPQGVQGVQGPQGNANVSSGTFTLSNANYKNDYWTITTGPSSALGNFAKKATVNVPAITSGIFNTGTVLVYLKTPNGLTATLSTWSLLPFDITSFGGGFFISIKFNYEVGKLYVYYLYMATDNSVTVPSVYSAVVPDYTFKYIIIAGNSGGRIQNPQVDYNDYAAVCRYYGIPE